MTDCSFLGCTNKRLSKITTICSSHRRQLLKTGELRPLAVRNRASSEGKTCVECGEHKPLSEFSPYSAGKNYYHPACTRCKPTYNKRSLIKSKYKISLEEYNELMSKGCEVCDSMSDLVLDHDHSCCASEFTCGKCLRGTLCSGCNRAEGYLKSSAENAYRLYQYLSMER